MKIVAAFVLIISTFNIVRGQESQIPAQYKVNELSKILSVDKAKASKIVEALDFNQDSIRAIASSETLMPGDKRRRIEQLEAERQEKIKSLLSQEQYAIIKEKTAEHAQARKPEAELHMREQFKKMKAKGEEQKPKLDNKKAKQ